MKRSNIFIRISMRHAKNMRVYDNLLSYPNFRSINEAINVLKPVYLHIFLEKCQLKHKVAKFLTEILLSGNSNERIIYLVHLYVAHIAVFNSFLFKFFIMEFFFLKPNEIRDLNFIETFNSLILYFENYQQKNSYLDEIFLKLFEIINCFDCNYSRDCSKEFLNLKLVFEKNQQRLASVRSNFILHLLEKLFI